MLEENIKDKEKENPQFKVFVNNVEFTTNSHEPTGAQIKALASVPADYELFQVKGDQTVPIGNEEIVHIHNNDHFRAIPAGTFGINDITA
ncbi:MAG: multiubiquitin domain-containing protein [Anaerolineales bacterium]|jgi:hypothetical protein